MSTTDVSETEVEKFVLDWFQKLDVHPPVEDMLRFLADEKLVMKMPERTFYRHQGFKEWYHGVEQYRDVKHTVKAMKIETNKNTANVKVINRWERSDSRAPNAEVRLAFYTAPTWTLERGADSESLRILTYDIEYFLEEHREAAKSQKF